MDKFVHLHNHSDYSLLDGLCKIKDLVKTSHDQKAQAVALTDHGNMFGALEFYTQAKEMEIKPLVGCELYMTPEDRKIKKTSKAGGLRYHLVLLAKNYTGYKNITRLASEAFVSGFYYKPRIDKQLLRDHSEGVICLSACLQGEIPQLVLSGNLDVALETAKFYKDIFGEDYYLEIQRHGIKEQEKIIPDMAQIGEDLGIKLVATNDTHYLKQDHAEAHDILLCVGTQSKVDDENRMRFTGNEFFLKSSGEMADRFEDYPEALTNTLEVAEKCNLEIELGEAHYPVFDIPGNDNPTFEDADVYLRETTLKGFHERYGDNPSQAAKDRFELEMKVILETGFSNYFLIVWDFIRWAKEQNVPIGPGRGSAAGCLVSYCLGITNLDPLQFDLIFERFLNPERISPPDIDIDFADDRREEVIDYVRDKYGDDSVCRITTFGKMAAKSAVRDVSRVIGLSIQEANAIAKLIPDGPKVKLAESMTQTPELKKLINSDPRFKRVWNIALTVEGSVRHSGTHAAGVVICPGRTVEYIPVYKMGGEGEEYTQFDMNWVDKLGLLKMDFLGLQTLTELDMTVKALKKRDIHIDLDTIDMGDQKVYELFSEGATIGVFQFESGGMRENLAKLKPTRIEDLIAMAALYRPGPMDNIPEYIACSHGKRQPTYLHPKLEPLLKETHGVVIYQEQVMQLSRILAKFTMGESDVLRKAIGKKKLDLMEKMEGKFKEG
ncbi:MAG: DNA polymerase III subunit alpha, partial [Calditrichaeota bacterium]|nr:DNA polymerase III subunit alpha [Calditrichota bacterium]